MTKTHPIGLWRGCAPRSALDSAQKIPVSVRARYDVRSGLLDLAAAVEIPPDLATKGALYGLGALAVVGFGRRAIRALTSQPRPAPRPIAGDLDLLDAELVTADELRTLGLAPWRRT